MMQAAAREPSSPNAIWLLAELRSRLPQADAYLARLEELMPVLQDMLGHQQLMALDRALESVDICLAGVSLDSAAMAPRGWRFWRKGPDPAFLSTLVMSEDLLRNYRDLTHASKAYLAWLEAGRKEQSRAYVEFCLEAKALERFLKHALRELETVYDDLSEKVKRARSDSALGALKTVHDKARLLADLLRQHHALSEQAQRVQDAVTELAAARERLLACLGPDFGNHAKRLQHYLDDIHQHDKAASRAEKVDRARTARAHLVVWMEQAHGALGRLHHAQQQLGNCLAAMGKGLAQLREASAGME